MGSSTSLIKTFASTSVKLTSAFFNPMLIIFLRSFSSTKKMALCILLMWRKVVNTPLKFINLE